MALIAWAKSLPADCLTTQYHKSSRPAGLRFNDAILLEVCDAAFDNLPVSLARLATDRLAPREEAMLTPYVDRRSLTAIFRTREDVTGLIQIVRMTERPAELVLRYKLVTTSPPHPPAVSVCGRLGC